MQISLSKCSGLWPPGSDLVPCHSLSSLHEIALGSVLLPTLPSPTPSPPVFSNLTFPSLKREKSGDLITHTPPPPPRVTQSPLGELMPTPSGRKQPLPPPSKHGGEIQSPCPPLVPFSAHAIHCGSEMVWYECANMWPFALYEPLRSLV